jgi:hypothetical protein
MLGFIPGFPWIIPGDLGEDLMILQLISAVQFSQQLLLGPNNILLAHFCASCVVASLPTSGILATSIPEESSNEGQEGWQRWCRRGVHVNHGGEGRLPVEKSTCNSKQRLTHEQQMSITKDAWKHPLP